MAVSYLYWLISTSNNTLSLFFQTHVHGTAISLASIVTKAIFANTFDKKSEYKVEFLYFLCIHENTREKVI